MTLSIAQQMQKTERRELIYQDRLAGMTFVQMSKKYRICGATVRRAYLQQCRHEEWRLSGGGLIPRSGLPDDTPIASLILSARTANCLKNDGIKTVGDLRGWSLNDLLDGQNFGKKSLAEVECLLPRDPIWQPGESAYHGVALGF